MGKWRERINKNKMWSAILMTVLVAGLGSAAWLLVLEDGFTGYVTSEGSQMAITLGFSDVNLETTDTADSATATMELTNINGDRSADVLLTSVVTDDDLDLCTDYEGDCDIVVELNSETIADGENVYIPLGVNTFEATITCQENSCPQDIVTEILLTDTGMIDMSPPVVVISNDLTYDGSWPGEYFGTVEDMSELVSCELSAHKINPTKYYSGSAWVETGTPIILDCVLTGNDWVYEVADVMPGSSTVFVDVSIEDSEGFVGTASQQIDMTNII